MSLSPASSLASQGYGFQVGDGTIDDVLFFAQGAPATPTTTATLTTAQLATGLLVVDQGSSSGTTQTLPTGTLMDAAFKNMRVDTAFDLKIVNIATDASADLTIAAGTGWTLVGNMVIASNAADTDISSATVRIRKTGVATWTLYR